MASSVVHSAPSSQPAKPRHRWYQFTLRTAGVWMVLLCLLLGSFAWWRDRAERQRKVFTELKELDAKVDRESFQLAKPASGMLADMDTRLLFSARVRYFLGEDFTSEITSVIYPKSILGTEDHSSRVVDLAKWTPHLRTFDLEGEISSIDLQDFPFTGTVKWFAIFPRQELDHDRLTDEDLAFFRGARQLEVLYLPNQSVEGPGLVHLQKCPLHELYLSGSCLEDQGLAHLSTMDKLKVLSLAGTRIIDRGLAETELPHSLECIVLTNSQTGDKSLERLQQLPNLSVLHVGQTAITLDGIRRFYLAKPKCTVVWDDVGDHRIIKRR